jgi:hypothetical protein
MSDQEDNQENRPAKRWVPLEANPEVYNRVTMNNQKLIINLHFALGLEPGKLVNQSFVISFVYSNIVYSNLDYS